MKNRRQAAHYLRPKRVLLLARVSGSSEGNSLDPFIAATIAAAGGLFLHMKLITFIRASAGKAEPGVALKERAVSLSPLGFTDMPDVLKCLDAERSRIAEHVANPPSDAVASYDKIQLLAPVPRPPKLFCVGQNYGQHVQESQTEVSKVPTIFSKFSRCVIGPGQAIVLPRNAKRPDYEAELAFVIGNAGRHIAASRWREHVAGYTIVNDVSARDVQNATSQWLLGKTFDTFAPMGPYVTTADEIEDPHTLDIRLTINGEELQHANTCELIYRVPELVEFLSSIVELEPGDVVCTGTPGGSGFSYKPPRWLRPGDDIEITIQGLGTLRNPVIAEAAAGA